MNTKEYFEFSEKFFDAALALSKRKNNDYTGGDDVDPFANFRVLEKMGQFENLEVDITAVGFITRMFDKLQRISSFTAMGSLQVKDESVADTLRDLANYCSLFAGYLESLKEKEVEKRELESF